MLKYYSSLVCLLTIHMLEVEMEDIIEPEPPNAIPAVPDEPIGRPRPLSEQEVAELQARIRETGRPYRPPTGT